MLLPLRLQCIAPQHKRTPASHELPLELMPKSVTRTIRIDDDLERSITKISKDDGISVNFVINTAVRSYSEWNVIAKKFGFVSVVQPFLNKLIDRFSEEECEDLGRVSGSEYFKPLAEYQFGELTFASSVETFRRLARYGGRYTFDSVTDGKTHVLFLRHGNGRKWSFYQRGLFKSVYLDILGLDLKTEVTDDLCMAQVKNPS
jgi:hypothetical protein